MKLCVVGTGYVGLVTGACFADAGNVVTCVDKNLDKIEKLKRSEIPIFEPGLKEVVSRNIEENRLFFVNKLSNGLKDATICFITVDTPPMEDGKADLTNVLAVADEIGSIITSPIVVVTKSTVPVGTTYRVKKVIEEKLIRRGFDPHLVDVASNPEFLKEGDAVSDFMKPHRVIVGMEKESVGQILHELYSPFMRRSDRFLKMDIPSSELSKYAANAMLATRISFMNEMARLCEKIGADINHVRRGLGSDPRVGPDFLYAGLGYGGSCFPKDTKALVQLGREHDHPITIVEAADRANDYHREWYWNKIVKHFNDRGGLEGKTFGVWGLAFKANTDDVRFAPSLYLIEKLVAHGALVNAFDPVAIASSQEALGQIANSVMWNDDAYACLTNADALIVCTEWREFRSPDFSKIKSLMKTDPIIFDGRNLYEKSHLYEHGFIVHSVG
ncbi:MAG: UDP-glucose/GDP-mannose dehydrogenase family protein [Pseudomonadota bacterium]